MDASTEPASVQIGDYLLDVGGRAGSFAQYEPAGEGGSETAATLGEALDERPRPVAAIEEFQETADAVTGKVEQAEQLLKAAANGRLTDLGNVNSEINALLDLFGRLDKSGRFEEELRLMRSLNGLLALTLRWLDLIRSLRSLLSSAEQAGHAAGKAFAQHELGSLYLCAGRPEEAVERLRAADRLKERIGDLGGRCATRHNLDSAARDLALRAAGGSRPPTRLQRLLVLGGAAAVAASAGAGLALAVHGRGGHHATASSTTETSPPPNHAVAVQIAGTGVGSIGGPGLACPSDCSTSIQDGRTITLTETHGSDSVFEGWSPGDCARSPTCKLRVTAGITVVATFSRTESTAPGAPLAPTGLAATSISATQVDLAWFKPTGKVAVDHYVIYRDQQPVGNVPAQQTSYEDTRVTPSTRYVYSVVAVAADQKASPSSSSTQATTLPSAPTLLSPKEPVKGEIDLEWTPAFPNPAGSYIVYRDGNKAEVVPGTQTSFSDTPVDTSVDHTYTVQAIDQFGKSSPQSNPGDFSPVG